ncbi:MAG: protein kinase, partial [Candidatus Margulisiibacteriota bacterium]
MNMKIINRDPANPVLGIRRVGGFNFGQQVGAGGFSRVVEERARCGRPVAIKFDTAEIFFSRNANRFIDREAAVLSVLDHPNIIKYLGHGKFFPRRTKSGEQRPSLAKMIPEASGSFLALEYLGDYRKANQFVEGAADRVGSVLFIIEKTALALAYLHNKGLVHADVKPANILANGANVKVIDFASARPEGQRIEPETEYWVMGTRGYLSLSRLKHNPPTKADDL